ncbi:MAG: UbiA family prenyltransferase [Acidobacteria bacterium]|nr:UbiA family prenyltransferase [Acidobacteriota bacterium]MCB9397528.1 UbiA family prenyltransferase [Acidobacteriota bacterium]
MYHFVKKWVGQPRWAAECRLPRIQLKGLKDKPSPRGPQGLAVGQATQAHGQVSSSFEPVTGLGWSADLNSESFWRMGSRAIRLHQWPKNALVVLPLFLAHRWSDGWAWAHAVMGFFSFSLCASAIYLMNDFRDRNVDRLHAQKRHRPQASGQLKPREALGLGLICLGSSLAAAVGLARSFGWVLIAYCTINVAYSMGLKRMAILDVLILAGLYALRVFAGSCALQIPVSAWLLAFSLFFFLSLALVKRFAELQASFRDHSPQPGRGYHLADRSFIAQMGASSGYLSVLVLALYIHSPEVQVLYGQPDLLWGVCLLLVYWLSRVWLLAHRGLIDQDPVNFALRDLPSYLVGGLIAALMLWAALP